MDIIHKKREDLIKLTIKTYGEQAKKTFINAVKEGKEDTKLDIWITWTKYAELNTDGKYGSVEEKMYCEDRLDLLLDKEQLVDNLKTFKKTGMLNLVKTKCVNFTNSKCFAYMLDNNNYPVDNLVIESIVNLGNIELYKRVFKFHNTSNDYNHAAPLVVAIKNGNKPFFEVLVNSGFRISTSRWKQEFGKNKSYGKFTEKELQRVII